MTAVRATGTVTASRALGSLVWVTLTVPGWPGACPGQFALLQAEHSSCFLGRPLSVADQDGEDVSFLIAPVGPGTQELCRSGPGRRVSVLGPLGHGFDLTAMGWAPPGAGGAPPAAGPADGAPAGRIVLVGGGVGVAPFPLFLSCLAAKAGSSAVPSSRPGGSGALSLPEVLVLMGFRDREQALGAVPVRAAADRLSAAGVRCRLEVVAEDGSAGQPERVSASLARELQPGDRVAVCGPAAMMEAVRQTCSQTAGVRAWFSLEAGMACGVGSCHGCSVTLAGGKTARVCYEGPVFSDEVLVADGTRSIAVEEGRSEP